MTGLELIQMNELELTREFLPWHTIGVDYVAQAGDEITLAKHSRCRMLFHWNDIQKPKVLTLCVTLSLKFALILTLLVEGT